MFFAKLKLNQAQKSKGQNAKGPIELTEIEKLLFAADDESDDSDNDLNEPFGNCFGASNRLGGSHRDEGLQADSNEGSSAQPNNLTNGGRPQRKPKSKNIFTFDITSFTILHAASQCSTEASLLLSNLTKRLAVILVAPLSS